MFDVTSLLVLVVAFSGVDAYERAPSEHREWYVSEYQEAVKAAEEAAKTTQQSIRRKKTRKQKTEAAAKAKALRQEVERLKKNEPPFLPDMAPVDFAEGRIGRIDGSVPIYSDALPYSIEVIQVIDEDDMLVVRTGRRYQASGNVRGSVSLTTVATRSEPFKLSGYPTRGAADGRVLQIEGVFRVSGTETYPTAIGGTNTVHVLTLVEDPGELFAEE